MEGLKFEQIGLILLIAAIVTIIARRFKIPYTVGLVLAGIFITVLPFDIEISLSKDLLFKVLLPPLIFEATLYINWSELRKDLSVVLTFATVGVLLSAGVTSFADALFNRLDVVGGDSFRHFDCGDRPGFGDCDFQRGACRRKIAPFGRS